MLSLIFSRLGRKGLKNTKGIGFSLPQNPAILNELGDNELLQSKEDSAPLTWRSPSLISAHKRVKWTPE